MRDSDATLLLHRGATDRGTALTARLCRRRGRPLLEVDLGDPPAPAQVRQWLAAHGVQVLNVAGPRESSAPGIQALAAAFLAAVVDATGSGRGR